MSTLPTKTGLAVCDLTFKEANAYVLAHHRHSEEDEGHKWSIGALADDEIVGVAIIGPPGEPRPR